ncbi:4a-hydroxytetrahydrobiopterin dehydratase [Hydrogenothermus marinus]|uniref:4a-hydroxytetrahydrobiopterin dehydratase n=1 Tax=Hydrogenothermus marinus TaxID=133270 RepID=A0A3M0B9I7_9AQUI|nr:4a-hydroxytetrahydrobiopterin dehydratase [Hydrogenothermus marinus]RMA93246.1 pterin-4-alpha-carbinolamine dehydratase [Hydrogenothermus marinus]
MENKKVLSEEEINNYLKNLENWKKEFKCITGRFYIEDWNTITQFLKHVAKSIEETNHHPDIIFHTATKTITISTTTHSEGGITQADIDLATKINNFFKKE